MKNTGLAIPFEVNCSKDNLFKKVMLKICKFFKAIAKRITEILFAVFCFFIFFIPLTILIKLVYIKDRDFKSIFEINECIGKNGKIFKSIKYRNINKDGTYNRLRTTGLDNVPKIINILKGNMTIVGPKPYLKTDKEKMGTYYNRIIQMKPGITGLFQISFVPEKTFEQRLDNDIKYFYGRNIWNDLKILLITLMITVPRRNKDQIAGFLKMTVQDIGRGIVKGINLFVKRIIDILGALVGIMILVPLTVVVAIVNFVSGDRGPIFYAQKRIGKNGKHFKMYKFRSMVIGADEILKELLEKDEDARKEFEENRKLKNDPRITKIGKFLRKTSLDEFPQFVNVLKGEMSLVGPRAVIDGEIEKFGKNKETVLGVKPGITGYWAANGRSDTTYDERVSMETFYAKNCNCVLDIKILFKTVYSVIKKEGAV